MTTTAEDTRQQSLDDPMPEDGWDGQVYDGTWRTWNAMVIDGRYHRRGYRDQNEGLITGVVGQADPRDLTEGTLVIGQDSRGTNVTGEFVDYSHTSILEDVVVVRNTATRRLINLQRWMRYRDLGSFQLAGLVAAVTNDAERRGYRDAARLGRRYFEKKMGGTLPQSRWRHVGRIPVVVPNAFGVEDVRLTLPYDRTLDTDEVSLEDVRAWVNETWSGLGAVEWRFHGGDRLDYLRGYIDIRAEVDSSAPIVVPASLMSAEDKAQLDEFVKFSAHMARRYNMCGDFERVMRTYGISIPQGRFAPVHLWQVEVQITLTSTPEQRAALGIPEGATIRSDVNVQAIGAAPGDGPTRESVIAAVTEYLGHDRWQLRSEYSWTLQRDLGPAQSDDEGVLTDEQINAL